MAERPRFSLWEAAEAMLVREMNTVSVEAVDGNTPKKTAFRRGNR